MCGHVAAWISTVHLCSHIATIIFYMGTDTDPLSHFETDNKEVLAALLPR